MGPIVHLSEEGTVHDAPALVAAGDGKDLKTFPDNVCVGRGHLA